MKIRALRDYTDNVLKKEIKKGDEYEVSNERGKQILSHPKNLAMLIEIVKEEVEVLEEAKELKEEVFVGDIKEHNEKALEEYKQAIKEYENSIENKIEESSKEDKPKTTTKKKVAKK